MESPRGYVSPSRTRDHGLLHIGITDSSFERPGFQLAFIGSNGGVTAVDVRPAHLNSKSWEHFVLFYGEVVSKCQRTQVFDRGLNRDTMPPASTCLRRCA